ncbi:MAG: RHS repeat domain-containing protein [Planctomycetota bacterium]
MRVARSHGVPRSDRPVYDAADNLIEMTDRLGRVTRYTCDEIDQLTEEL